MSTKIFNGYRVRGCAETAALFKFNCQLRTVLTPVYRALYIDALTRVAVVVADLVDRGEQLDLDERCASMLTDLRSPLLYAARLLDFRHQDIERTSRRNPSYDFQFDVVYLVDPDEPTDVYALICTEQDDYLDVFGAQPGVEHWPYWNNTDRPDDVSEADWEHRRVTWDRLIGHTPPARIGLRWQLTGSGGHPFHVSRDVLDEVAAILPNLDRMRANRIAERHIDWTLDDGMEALAEKIQAKAPEILSTLRQWTAAELRTLPEPSTSEPEKVDAN